MAAEYVWAWPCVRQWGTRDGDRTCNDPGNVKITEPSGLELSWRMQEKCQWTGENVVITPMDIDGVWFVRDETAYTDRVRQFYLPFGILLTLFVDIGGRRVIFVLPGTLFNVYKYCYYTITSRYVRESYTIDIPTSRRYLLDEMWILNETAIRYLHFTLSSLFFTRYIFFLSK